MYPQTLHISRTFNRLSTSASDRRMYRAWAFRYMRATHTLVRSGIMQKSFGIETDLTGSAMDFTLSTMLKTQLAERLSGAPIACGPEMLYTVHTNGRLMGGISNAAIVTHLARPLATEALAVVCQLNREIAHDLQERSVIQYRLSAPDVRFILGIRPPVKRLGLPTYLADDPTEVSTTLLETLHYCGLNASEAYPVLAPDTPGLLFNPLHEIPMSDPQYTTVTRETTRLFTVPYAHHRYMYRGEDAPHLEQLSHKRLQTIPYYQDMLSFRERLFPYMTEFTIDAYDALYTFPEGRRRSFKELATDPKILECLADDRLNIAQFAHMCGFHLSRFIQLFIVPFERATEYLKQTKHRDNAYPFKPENGFYTEFVKIYDMEESSERYVYITIHDTQHMLHYMKDVRPFFDLFRLKYTTFQEEIIGKYGNVNLSHIAYARKVLLDAIKFDREKFGS